MSDEIYSYQFITMTQTGVDKLQPKRQYKADETALELLPG